MISPNEVDASTIVHEQLRVGFGPFIGVPCSVAAPLVIWCGRNAHAAYITANDEGKAVAMATGSYFGSKQPAVMLCA
jgi:phosphonopyruvate decarboxylase